MPTPLELMYNGNYVERFDYEFVFTYKTHIYLLANDEVLKLY